MSAKIFERGANKVLSENRIIRSASSRLLNRQSLTTTSLTVENPSNNVHITLTDGSKVEFYAENILSRDNLNQHIGNVKNVASVEIGANISNIAPGTFYYCNNLNNVVFMENSHVKTIGKRAFENTILNTLFLPESIETISPFAFRNISHLESINVDVNNSYFSSNDGKLYNKTGDVLLKHPEGRLLDIIDLYDLEVSEIGIGALEQLSFASSMYLPKSLLLISQRGLGDYSYGSTVQKMDSLIIPINVMEILSGAFDNMVLTTLITHNSISYSKNSFQNCIISNIYIKISNGNFVKGAINSDNIIVEVIPHTTATISEIISNGIVKNDLERYDYLNSDKFIDSMYTNGQMIGKYINTYYIDSKKAINSHYITLSNKKYDYSDAITGEPLLWQQYDNGVLSDSAVLTYRVPGEYDVSSTSYNNWNRAYYNLGKGENITISDNTGDLTMPSAVFTKVMKFPFIALDNGLYKYNHNLLLVKNNTIKNYSTNVYYNFDKSNGNYTSINNTHFRGLTGVENLKQYFIENEMDEMYNAHNMIYLQEVGSNYGNSNNLPKRTDNGGFTMSVLKNETMPIRYMTIFNRFSTIEISHLTNLIKYVLTIEVDEMNGPPGFFYTSIKTFNDKSNIFYSMEKNSIPNIGTYTMTFLTQKSIVENFNSEQVCIEAIGNISSDVNVNVSSCSLDVQIYDENPQDYYIGNSLILDDGEYVYNDAESLSFFCYKKNDNNYLLFNNKDTYMFSRDFGVYINMNDDRLYFICNSEYIENATNKKIYYNFYNSSITSSILNKYFTFVGNFAKRKSALYVSNKMTLTDLLFYNKFFKKSVSIFSDKFALTNILSLLNNYIELYKNENNTETQKIKNEITATYIPYKLLKSIDDNSISYWNINSDHGISLNVDSDINNDDFFGYYIIEIFIQ